MYRYICIYIYIYIHVQIFLFCASGRAGMGSASAGHRLGIGSGGWLGGFAADAAWKRGGVVGGLALLAGLQIGVGLLAYAVMWQYNELPFIFVELYEWFFNSGLDYGWLWVGKLCLAIALMLPPCLLMGATFPAMVRVASSDSALGATTGRIYGWNTVGSILGASVFQP